MSAIRACADSASLCRTRWNSFAKGALQTTYRSGQAGLLSQERLTRLADHGHPQLAHLP